MYQFRGKLRPRPVGLPGIGYHQAETGTSGAVRDDTVPYRLPKTHNVQQEEQGGTTEEQEGPENLVKLWSDYDLDYDKIRNFTLQSTKVFKDNAKKTLLDSRRVYSHPAYSKYRLGIEPEDRFVHLSKCDEPQMVINSVQQLRLQRSKTEDLSFPQIDPSPSPLLRSNTASPTKSIKWALGSKKHLSFDRQGRGHFQGPFSRMFTVTCSAPTNWLRMRLGQQPHKTTGVELAQSAL